MRVLILHQHFNTPEKGGPLRSYYLSKALVDRGIETIVISGYNGTELKEENVEGIRILYLPIAYDNRFGFYQRGRAFLKYIFGAVNHMRKFRDVDLCYAISAPMTTGLAAWIIKKRYKVPYIFEVGDLWPDAPIQLGLIRNYFFKRGLVRLEKMIYRGSESVVALSDEIERRIKEKIQSKTVDVIPNMSDVQYFTPPLMTEVSDTTSVRSKVNLVVSYIGALGLANGVDYLLDCAHQCLKNDLPVNFIICGEGARKDVLKKKAQDLKLSNITWFDFQNREGVKRILDRTDAVFVSFLSNPILETGCPHKYTEGLAAGKLIIVNFGGWIRQEIETTKCGVYVDPRDPSDFLNKIRPFLENEGFLIQHKNSSRKLGEIKYSRVKIAERFSKIILAREAT